MRPIRLGRALAAAATLLAVAPAGASAVGGHPKPNGHKHAGAISRCGVSLFAEDHLITTGESVQVFGALSCPGHTNAAAGQTVTLYEHSGGTPGVKIIGTAMTGPGGFYSIAPLPVTVDSFFYARVLGAQSATKRVKVAPQVTLSGPANGSQLFTGVRGGLRNRSRNAVTFTGTVTPAADEGAAVVLQRENATSNEQWHAIQRGIVGPGGAFSITHTFIVPGDANVRVVVRPHGKFTIHGQSSPLSYEISQAENPMLTINASADPVAYGQPVTLTGVLAGGASKSVTLEAHPRGVPGFTAVAKGMTNGSGEYKFLVPSALQNTHYRVTAAGINSADLYEGVRYVLTAGLSPSTVQSGQPVTFSGAVAPARIGHVVYLERQNVFGGGFHVVDIGTVSASATYAISHVVFGSGNEVFRVGIPGDPENQAASSSPFTVEVTPAPAASLHPVTPGVLPSEGQI
jgi:hypothetical protein